MGSFATQTILSFTGLYFRVLQDSTVPLYLQTAICETRFLADFLAKVEAIIYKAVLIMWHNCMLDSHLLTEKFLFLL